MIRLVGKAGEPARSLQRRTTVVFALSTGCDRSKMLRFANAIIARPRKRRFIRIGTEIRCRRQKLGISQGVLATKAGVHVNVVGRTTRGKYNPTVMTLDAIAAALNTSMVDLLRGAFK